MALSGGKYGSGTSPIIIGNTVVLSRDQDRYSSLLAVDVRTGKKLWEVPRVDAAGSFGSPTHWRNEGVDEVVLASSAQLKGYDVKTGGERWVITNVSGLVCTTAIVADGMLFFGAWSPGQADAPREPWPAFLKKNDKNGDGAVAFDEIDATRRDYTRGIDKDRDGKLTEADWIIMAANAARSQNLLIAVRPGGNGDITETHVTWKYRKGLPYVPSPLHYDGRVYLVKDGGLITSVDAKTGEPYYAQERLGGASGNYYAAPVAADGKIYVSSLPGKVTVIKAGGDKPEILHQVDFGERILATPAIVGERLYVRTTTKLWAFGK